MTVTVKLFGMLKTQLHGESELQVRLEQGRRVDDLILAIRSMNPDVGELLLERKILVSVNQDIAHGETELASSDDIALLPPFSGGSCASERTASHVYR